VSLTENRFRALDVACPKCGAPAERYCVMGKSRPLPSRWHAGRGAAWYKARDSDPTLCVHHSKPDACDVCNGRGIWRGIRHVGNPGVAKGGGA